MSECVKLENKIRTMIQEKVNTTYKKGLQDAWELAKKLSLKPSDGGLDDSDILKIFGCGRYCVLAIFSVEEALAKLATYGKGIGYEK